MHSKGNHQPTEWEKIFANDMINNMLISNIYKHFTQHWKDSMILKWAKNWIEFFQRENADEQQAHENILNITNL